MVGRRGNRQLNLHTLNPMAKAYFIPPTDTGKRDWLNHLAERLPVHATTVGVSTGEKDSVIADALFFDYVIGAQTQFTAASQQWTAYKNAARNGTDSVMGAIPTAPTLDTAPALVAPGIFSRVSSLCARIKKHPGYTDAIGQDLDIIGAEQTVDTTHAKPVLKLELQAGKPNVKWTKGGFDGVEIWVDRGNGTFAFLAIDTVPDYLDTAALPAPGLTALWKYKAIYRLNDAQVGEWSDVVSLAVQG